MELLIQILIPALFAVMTAIVYCDVLTDTGMLLDWWSRFLHNHIKKEWILKPLVDCVYCFGGQLALWSGFFIWNDYKLLTHFLYIITVIFFIHIYKLIWN